MADLEWLPAAVDAWRVPKGLSIWTFLNSGFAANVSYRLSVHGSESPEQLRFSENLLVGTIEPYLEDLRSHGVEAVFVSGPHFGWGLALPTLWQREPAV